MKRADIALWACAAALAGAVCVLAWGLVPPYPPAHVETVATAADPDDPDVTAAPAVLDLNAATAEQLCALPGLGEVLAARILAWREAHGGFSAVEELLQVEGVGEKRLESWRERLTV